MTTMRQRARTHGHRPRRLAMPAWARMPLQGDSNPVLGLNAILIGREVKPCNLMTWARWFEAASRTPGPDGLPTVRHIGYDDLGFCHVSTVFLGVNVGFGGRELWFETMVFAKDEANEGKPRDLDMFRYSTYDEAEAGHARVVSKIKERPWIPSSLQPEPKSSRP